jgi:hypothetical protein
VVVIGEDVTADEAERRQAAMRRRFGQVTR